MAKVGTGLGYFWLVVEVFAFFIITRSGQF